MIIKKKRICNVCRKEMYPNKKMAKCHNGLMPIHLFHLLLLLSINPK